MSTPSTAVALASVNGGHREDPAGFARDLKAFVAGRVVA